MVTAVTSLGFVATRSVWDVPLPSAAVALTTNVPELFAVLLSANVPFFSKAATSIPRLDAVVLSLAVSNDHVTFLFVASLLVTAVSFNDLPGVSVEAPPGELICIFVTGTTTLTLTETFLLLPSVAEILIVVFPAFSPFAVTLYLYFVVLPHPLLLSNSGVATRFALADVTAGANAWPEFWDITVKSKV